MRGVMTSLLTCLGLSNVITQRDRSTQTSDVIAGDSASSPARKPRRDLYARTAPEVASRRESPASTHFRCDGDDDEETGSELLLCSRCGAAWLTRHDATVGRYLVLRERTPQPRDDVTESRDRRAKALHSRSSSLRHEQIATDADAAAAAVDEVVIITSGQSNLT